MKLVWSMAFGGLEMIEKSSGLSQRSYIKLENRLFISCRCRTPQTPHTRHERAMAEPGVPSASPVR